MKIKLSQLVDFEDALPTISDIYNKKLDSLHHMEKKELDFEKNSVLDEYRKLVSLKEHLVKFLDVVDEAKESLEGYLELKNQIEKVLNEKAESGTSQG